MQLQEVERDVVTEVSVPQVKTSFRYKGQGMGFEKGEVCLFVCLSVCLLCIHNDGTVCVCET